MGIGGGGVCSHTGEEERTFLHVTALTPGLEIIKAGGGGGNPLKQNYSSSMHY